MRDFRMSGADLVREAINREVVLPEDATATNLIFGKPSSLVDDPRGDSTVALRGVEDTFYSPSLARVYFTKVDLAVLFQGNYTPRFNALGQSNLYRLLPDINKSLGITLTPDDLEDIDVRQLGEGDELNLELRAKPGSIAYKGVTTVVFNRRRVLFSDVIVDNTFEELKHPDRPLEGEISAGLLTWGLDFTPIWRDLEVDHRYTWRRGNFVNLTALRTSLSTIFGIDNWPGNNPGRLGEGLVRRYDTRRVLNANKDFQWVVVQTMIQTNGYSGTAYFHYNQPT
jgi:hypothetical protein